MYIALFTCTTTRAIIHLELATNMSTNCFLLLLRRFCAKWSVPHLIIISDNGTNFVASAKFIESMTNYPSIIEFFQTNGIVWKFIAPRAPWKGGSYERLIKTVKYCLRKVLFKKTSLF